MILKFEDLARPIVGGGVAGFLGLHQSGAGHPVLARGDKASLICKAFGAGGGSRKRQSKAA